MSDREAAAGRLEAALRAEAAGFRRRRREAEGGTAFGVAPGPLLARFLPGLDPALLCEPARLPAACRPALLDRLRAEDGRLRRFARSGDPRYDLGRHVGLRRLIGALRAPHEKVIEPAAPPCAQAAALASAARGRRRRAGSPAR